MKRHKKVVNLIPLKARRFKITYIFFLLLIFGLFGRLVNLQVFSSSNLQKKARLIQFTKTSSLNSRRSIVDRNNRLIAYDKTLYKLWAHPKYFRFSGDKGNKVRGINEVVKKISPILDIKNEFLLAKFNNDLKGIARIDEITEDKAEKLKDLQISGRD